MDWNNGFEEEEEKQEEDDLESDSSSMEDDSSDDDDSQDNDRAADGTFRLDPSVRDHVLYMDVDASYFGRQAEALTDPRHEDLLETVEELVLDPSLANGPSAQAVAEFLESIEWLRRLTFTRYFAPTSIVINLDQLGRYMDLWLAAATRNTQLHLTSFDYGLCAASLPVFRDFYRTKVTGIMLHLQAAPVHFMNLRHYLLDPDLGLDALAIHMDWNEGTPTLQELERWLPQTTTLEKLQIHFPRRLNPALDHSPIFLSPTVHALELVRGRIDHVPANATLRQLSLTETRLDGNASTPLASLTSLESLSLTKCHVEEGQSFSLQPVLAANIASLQSLTFKDNTFGTDDDAWWQELLPFLRKSLACRCLSVVDSVVSSELVADLCDFFSPATNVVWVVFTWGLEVLVGPIIEPCLRRWRGPSWNTTTPMRIFSMTLLAIKPPWLW